MEMTPLEGGVWPMAFHEALGAFLPVSHDHGRRREAKKESVPGAIAFSRGEPPEDLVIFRNGDQGTKLVPVDELCVNDENSCSQFLGVGTVRILAEEWCELFGERTARDAVALRDGVFVIDAPEPRDETISVVPLSRIGAMDNARCSARHTPISLRTSFCPPISSHPLPAEPAYFVMFLHEVRQADVWLLVKASERARYHLAFSFAVATKKHTEVPLTRISRPSVSVSESF